MKITVILITADKLWLFKLLHINYGYLEMREKRLSLTVIENWKNQNA